MIFPVTLRFADIISSVTVSSIDHPLWDTLFHPFAFFSALAYA